MHTTISAEDCLLTFQEVLAVVPRTHYASFSDIAEALLQIQENKMDQAEVPSWEREWYRPTRTDVALMLTSLKNRGWVEKTEGLFVGTYRREQTAYRQSRSVEEILSVYLPSYTSFR